MTLNGRNTTAGVVFWTPAPNQLSPTSSVASEWENEEEEEEDAKREEEDDFHSYMDENGIIGLEEALDGAGLGEEDDGNEDPGGEGDPPWYAGVLDPNEDSLGREGEVRLGPERGEALEDLLDSEPLSLTEPIGDDTLTQSFYDQESVEVWTEEEEMRSKEEEEEREQETQTWRMLRQSTERLPERDRQLDMTEDEREREAESEGSLGRPERSWTEEGREREEGGRNPQFRLRYGVDLLPESGERLTEDRGHGTERQVGRVSGSPSPSSGRLSSTPVSPSPLQASVFPHLRHFSSEELADAPGIEAETFPDSVFTESLQESRGSGPSRSSEPRWKPASEGDSLISTPAPAPGGKVSASLNGAGDGPAEGMDDVRPGTQPSPAPRKSRLRSPETGSPLKALPSSLEPVPQDQGHRTPRERPLLPQGRSQRTEVDEDRRGPLTYRTPDFSRVEPRVRFPKSGYTPPKSRGSPKKRPFSVEPPLVYKSPADIVTEVLLSGTDGPPGLAQPGANVSMVPEEFRCPRQATTLVHQLQEDYNRLLTKYAEAENTIDRMRLEAKVNLYSDPPKPGHAVQSGVFHGGLKVMTLSFPQAQRAELHSGDVHLTGQGAHQVCPSRPSSAASSRSSASHVGRRLTRALSQQAERFLQQVLTFSELLRSGRLKPFDQMQGLSQLAQGLDSLERGYLSARDQHRLLLQRGLETGPFDPDRELEGRIFQCGMQMEDLKEQVEQTGQQRPASEAPPSPPPQPTPQATPTGGREALPCPESPVVPVAGQPHRVVGAEVSSASEEEEEGGSEEEDGLPSLLLQPLTQKHRLVERDFSTLLDQYQNFRELPMLLGEGASVSVSAGAQHSQPGEGRLQEAGSNQRRPSLQVSKAVPGTSTPGPLSPQTPSQSRALPGRRAHGSRGSEGRKSRCSSLTSLPGSAPSERRGSTLQQQQQQPGSKTVTAEDGVISPGTDSGFVGSESSRLNVAVPAPHHRRAPVSVSTTPDLRPASLSGQPPPAHRAPYMEDSRTRSGEGRVASASSSPQHWRGSGTSEFGPESDQAHTVSGEEEGPSDRNSYPSYGPSPSPTAPNHHDDPHPAQRAGQLTHGHEAIQCLQAEVNRLKERLEGSLRHANPQPFPGRAPPSAREGYFTVPLTSTPLTSSTQRRRHGRKEILVKERNGRVTQVEEGEKDSPRATPRGRSASVPRRRPELEITTDSEQAKSTPKPQSSKRIPESPAVWNSSSQTEPVKKGREHASRRSVHTTTLPAPSASLSVGWPGGGDEPDARGRRQAPVCPQCDPRRQGLSARPERGATEPFHTAPLSSPCRRCGQTDRRGNASADREPMRNRSSGHAPRGPQPTGSPHWDGRGVYLAAPAPPPVLGAVPLVHCVPLCAPAPPLLYYSSAAIKTDSYLQPFYVSPNGGGGGLSSGVRGRAEVRGRAGRSHSADQYSINKSLNRAIQAARDMKEASRRMARSMATGLHHQEALSRSCIY